MRETTADDATVFSRDQLVHDFQETCAPRQRILLSLLAICQRHELDPTQIVASLAHDLPRTPLESRRKTRKFYWSRVQEFSEELKQAPAIPDALEKFPGLLPNTVELALRLEQDNGTLNELNEAWLDRPPEFAFDSTRNQLFVARMIPLFLKTLVILCLVAFVLIKIFPEFQAMMQEFGVEPPPIFALTLRIFDVFDVLVENWFVLVLLILIAIPFCFSALFRYFRRWNPFVWRHPTLASNVSVRQALALVTAHGKTIPANALRRFKKLNRALKRGGEKIGETPQYKELDWKMLASKRIISGQEAKALQIADSNEAQAWLLRESAITQNDRIEDRGLFFTRAVVTLVNLILGALVLLFALTIFATLIGIMAHMQ